MTHARRTSLWSVAIVSVLSVGWQLARVVAGEGAASSDTRTRHARPAPDEARALPDSVLASVGTSRMISVSAFRDAWSRTKGSAPLDSLTPEEARRFLGLLADRELLAERASGETWTWTPAEDASFRAVRDRLMISAALDSALEEARRRLGKSAGDTASSLERLGIMLRDSTVARMGVRLDERLLERLARAWSAISRPVPGSSVSEQLGALSALPAIDPADTQRMLATLGDGVYRVNDLLDSWRRLSIAYRPRIGTASQLRDLVWNGLFERALRRKAETRRLDLRPDIAEALGRAREEIAIAHLVEREVYRKIARDSVAVLRFYQRHRDAWELPLRVRVIRLVLPDRATAERMATRLSDPAAAESLAAQARRRGVDYVTEWSPGSDSVHFAAAMRAGAGRVLGPVPEGGDWLVARVSEILPGRVLRFDEIRHRVEAQWMEAEAERLTRALCDRLGRGTRVIVNERALAAMLAHPPGRSGFKGTSEVADHP